MIIDGIVIAVLLISAIISFLRGFIRETLTILGVAGGLAAAYYGGPILAPIVKNMLGVHEGEPPHKLFNILPYPILADILSYGAIFIVIVIILSIVSHMLAESARAVGLGSLDRTLGIFFGLARGALLLAILYLPVYIGVDKTTKEEWFKGSKTDVYLEEASGKIASMIPQSAVKNLDDAGKKMEEQTESGVKAKLEQIDLLKKDQPAKPADGAPAASDDKSGQGGYSDEFRAKMKEMFKDETAAPAQPSTTASPPQDKPTEEPKTPTEEKPQ